MNNPENQYKPNGSDLSSEFIPAASHYALKLAFQSLKERFDKLQNRFCFIEEENIRLKEYSCKNNDKENLRIEILEKRIDDLSRQKSQLSHHIFMLANENKNLWDSISKLSEEKQILLEQIRDLDKSLNSLQIKEKQVEPHSYRLNDTNIEGSTHEECYVSDNISEEDKDSIQSIETVKEFSLVGDKNDLDLLEINNEMKDIEDRLNKDKSHLQQQQEGLKKALENLKKLCLGMKLWSMYFQHLKTDGEESSIKSSDDIKRKLGNLINCSKEINSSTQEFGDIDNSFEMRCPLCRKLIVENATAEEHHLQFLSHVEDCTDIDTVLKSFEVIA